MKTSTLLHALRWVLPASILVVGGGTVLTASRFMNQPEPVGLARAEFNLNTVAQWKAANSTPWDTIVTNHPTLLFDEDFTDGAFDNIGARKSDGSLHWNLFGGTMRWGIPQNRPAIPLALVRNPAAGGADWEGAQWHSEEPMIYLDKLDDISVIKWTSFSDLARRPETYGVEIAMLEETSDPMFQGNPHYGHDQSWEGMTQFSNDRAQGARQLDGNVENTNNVNPEGVKRAHFRSNGGYMGLSSGANAVPFDSAFDQAFTSIMLFRKDFVRNKANIEQWGHANYADYNLDTNMVSLAEPNHKFNKFNMIQVTLFRQGLQTGAPFVKRSNISNDSLQVGVTHVMAGVTKRADFNVDFKIDSLDGAVIAANWGRMTGATLREGDATNEGRVDLNDALPLAAWMPNRLTGMDSVVVNGTYNPTTGEVVISCRNINFLKIVSPTAQLTGSSPAYNGLSPLLIADSDTMTGVFRNRLMQLTNYSLGNIAATGLNQNALYMVVNYPGSPNSNGFLVPFNMQVLVDNKPSLTGFRMLEVEGQHLRLPVSGKAQTAHVFDLSGRLLHTQSLPGGTQPQQLPRQLAAPAGMRIIRVFEQGNQKPIFSQKYYAQ